MDIGKGIAEGIGAMIIMAIVVTAIVVTLVVGGIAYIFSDDDEIVRDSKLEPKMVITITDGVADTTYVYNTGE